MENNKKFQLRFGTRAQYNVATKNANDIYFITDSKQIYVGETLYTGGFEAVTTFPEAPAQGVLYLNTATLEVKVHNGTSWNVLIPSILSSIPSSGSNDSLASVDAIRNYVTSKAAASDKVFIATYGSMTDGPQLDSAYNAKKALFCKVVGTGEYEGYTYFAPCIQVAEGIGGFTFACPQRNKITLYSYSPNDSTFQTEWTTTEWSYFTKEDLVNTNNALGFDTTPKADSNKPVTSQGIKSYVDSKVVDYSIVKDEEAGEGYSATYHLTKGGVNTGAAINIPRDMVVSSGTVVTKDEAGEWGAAGTYLVLTLANATSDKVYINVGSLIEYVTSGSGENDPIQVVVDGSTHKVTASVKNGSLTLAMLHSDVQASLGKADSALQASDITEGATNGTIKVKNTNVAVHGLGSAAYHTDSDFEAAGSAEGVRTTLIGADTDAATADTIKGAKKYADSAASGAIESAAGSGLAHSNGTLSVDVDGTTIVIGTGGKVSAASATDTHIGAVAIGHTDVTEATLAVKLDNNKAAYIDNPMVWKSI